MWLKAILSIHFIHRLSLNISKILPTNGKDMKSNWNSILYSTKIQNQNLIKFFWYNFSIILHGELAWRSSLILIPIIIAWIKNCRKNIAFQFHSYFVINWFQRKAFVLFEKRWRKWKFRAISEKLKNGRNQENDQILSQPFCKTRGFYLIVFSEKNSWI